MAPTFTDKKKPPPSFLKSQGECSNVQDIFCDPDLDNLEFYKATYIGYEAKVHSHEEYTIGVIDTGNRGYLRGEKTFTAKRGNLLLINPNEPHGGFPLDDKPWKCRAFYPTRKHLEKYLGLDEKEKPFPDFPEIVINDREAYRAFDNFFRIVETSPYGLEKQSAFIEVMQLLNERFSRARQKTGEIPHLNNMAVSSLKKFIEENYSHKLGLEELARVAGVHPNYLVKLFQKKTGFTPHNYVMDLRLRIAKDKIRMGESPAEVAAEVGFFDQSHMNNVFRSVLGMTPKQYQIACQG